MDTLLYGNLRADNLLDVFLLIISRYDDNTIALMHFFSDLRRKGTNK